MNRKSMARLSMIALLSVCLAVLLCGSALGAKPIDVHIYGLNWQTDWVNQMLDEWEKSHPGITVTFHGEAAYYDKILMMLMTQPQKVDICLLNPGYLVPWVQAGWIAASDNLPGIEERKKMIPQEQIGEYTYKGKIYAPGAWYQLNEVMVYNERILQEAGFSRPPTTWDELIKQCVTIKQKGLAEHPLPLYYKPTTRRLDWVWLTIALSFSGPNRPIWDEDLNPLFLEPKSPGYRSLEYMRDFVHKYKITSPAALEMDTFDVVNAMMRGQAAFTITGDFQLASLSDPEKNREIGNIKIMMMPESGYTWAKADGFVMTKGAERKGQQHKLATWEVLKFFTGPEFAKLNLKQWFGPSIFPETYKDPEVQQIVKKVVPNPDVYYKQREKTLNLQLFVEPVHKTAFYFQYLEDFVLPNLQKAVMNTISVDEALKNINDAAQNLKKEYGM